MPESIKKRDGRLVPYDEAKIASAIDRAFVAAESGKGADEAERLAKIVTREMNAKESNETPSVEDIQDQVEQVLIAEGYAKTAKAYILYRAERSRTREAKTRLMHILEDITFKDASESDVKRENANIDGDTAMGTMLKYGSESAKQFYDMYVLNPEHARAHREGDIHIHDLDFLTLTTTCTQIDLTELFKGGFSTGHGVLREPQDIGSYSALACIAIQSNQNDQHGGQAIASFDYDMAPGVAKTYIKEYRRALGAALELLLNHDAANDEAKAIVRQIRAETGAAPTLKPNKEFDDALRERLLAMTDEATAERMHSLCDRARLPRDRAPHLSGDGGVHPQPEYDALPRGRADAVLFHQLRHGYLAGGAHGDAQPAAGDGKRLGQRRNADFPDSDFPRQRGRELQPRRPELRPVPAGYPRERQAPVPEFLVRGCAVQPQVLQAGPSRDGNRLHGLPHARDRQRLRPARARSAIGRGNLSFTSINLPRIAIESQGRHRSVLQDAG